jgi:hypothetical protein
VRGGDVNTRRQIEQLSWFCPLKVGRQESKSYWHLDVHLNQGSLFVLPAALEEAPSLLPPAKKVHTLGERYRLKIIRQHSVFLIYLNDRISRHEKTIKPTKAKVFDDTPAFVKAVSLPTKYLLEIEYQLNETLNHLSKMEMNWPFGLVFKKSNDMIALLKLNVLKEYERVVLREIARYESQITQFQQWARVDVDSSETTQDNHKMVHGAFMLQGDFLQERLNRLQMQCGSFGSIVMRLKQKGISVEQIALKTKEIVDCQERLTTTQKNMQAYIQSDYFKLREALKTTESVEEKVHLSERSIQCSVEFFAEGNVLSEGEHQRLCRSLLLKDEQAQSQYRAENAGFHEKILKNVEKQLGDLMVGADKHESEKVYLSQACQYFFRVGDVVILEQFRRLVDQYNTMENPVIQLLKEKLGPSKQELSALLSNRAVSLALYSAPSMVQF